ncbi:protein-methionine-sulfoxide reductase catalytic subunit MsrP [Tistrella mobilis]|uniref:protein-methionine-sulfoxide reductase catalytic subunit MsrP n=1 Tax=Tistrella mobilis TaxID=171437 RepID=UPI0035587D0A
MRIIRRRSWELPERAVTPEAVWRDRRAVLKGLGLGMAGAVAGGLGGGLLMPGRAFAYQPGDPTPDTPWGDLYPVKTNPAYADPGRPVTVEKTASSYNNFYEFGTHKRIWPDAQKLKVQPWTVTIDGMVDAPQTLDADALIRRMALEERIYRFRCVEAWSMVVPWSGFPLADLVKLAQPKAGAKYLRMETFEDREMAHGQRSIWLPWPYVEGLTMAEATNDLAFIATGIYGKPLPRQHGAPLRLVVPWKYGFKSIKSIVRFTFTDERPVSFWEQLQDQEYGFWANVNPEVSHPRWSQAREQVIDTGEEIPTLKWNGYGDQVAGLYTDIRDGDRLFH